MTAPYVPPEVWIKRIQNAMSISRSDPRWVDAQAAIPQMQEQLKQSIPVASAGRQAESQQELQQAQTMGPVATGAEDFAQGLSFGLGRVAANLAGEGPTIQASEAAHPVAAAIGGGLGTLASGALGGAALNELLGITRGARMAKLSEESAKLNNAIKAEKLAQLRGAGAATEPPAGTSSIWEQLQSSVKPTEAPPEAPVAPKPVGPTAVTPEASPAGATATQPMTETAPTQDVQARLELLRQKVRPELSSTAEQPEVGPTGAQSAVQREAMFQPERVENLPLANQVQKALVFGKGTPYSPETRSLIKTLLGQFPAQDPFTTLGTSLGIGSTGLGGQ